MRVPALLDTFFRPRFHWNHDAYFGRRVLVMAFAWGRRHGANFDRSLDAPPHRTRCHHFFLVQRWDAEVALCQKAQKLLRALHPMPGEPLSLLLDDATQSKRNKAMDAVAKMEDSTHDAYIRDHQDGCGILGFRQPVLPYGIRLYVNKEPVPR